MSLALRLQAAAAKPGPSYTVRAHNLAEHYFEVTMVLREPEARQRVSLPVWIPGSYMVREFARHITDLKARQGRAPVAIAAADKCTWIVACEPGQTLTLSYRVYAFDRSVRTAFLDSTRAFFNGTSLLLRAHGKDSLKHKLLLDTTDLPAHWSIATALRALKPTPAQASGTQVFWAANYDELVDSPVEIGALWRGRFELRGVVHELAISGATPGLDGPRLLQDTRAICQAVIAFWHPDVSTAPPMDRYTFLLHATDEGYGGLEHRFSTALICCRKDLPRRHETKAPEGYTTLLGLISHEYFHTWNVKRLRPAEFARIDYSKENHTRLLWFFEGFTSYYDDILVFRAGRIDCPTYLSLLAKTLQHVHNMPGRQVHSVAQASHDAWIKYYRPDENTPNTTVSYYTKGALVALCLDLSLRREGAATLDEVMRALWHRTSGGPMTEADVLAALAATAGRSFVAEIQAWVHGTDELPVAELLQSAGITVTRSGGTRAQQWGLVLKETPSGLQVQSVVNGSLAAAAGFSAADEWLAVQPIHDDEPNELTPATEPATWRITRLDDLTTVLPEHCAGLATVARDRRLLTLTLPASSSAHHQSVWMLETTQQPKGAGTTTTDDLAAKPLVQNHWPLE
jgi:predicted metalloprotease with PDZ domain